MSSGTYIPGVCNIGRKEVQFRKGFGWISFFLTLGIWAGLVLCEARAPWRLVLFFPAFMTSMGYLQAKWHFCAKFGLAGVFNFGPNVGKTDTVEQAEFRRQDRAKAWQIIGYAFLAGAVAALAAYLLPL